MCEAFFEWQPMEASRLRCCPPARAHHCRAAANPSGLCSCHRPASGAVCTQLRSVRAATDGSRWQLRSRGSAGEAPAEECKGTLGCPQQWASGTGLWCRLVTLWGAGLGTWWAGRFRSGFRAHEPRRRWERAVMALFRVKKGFALPCSGIRHLPPLSFSISYECACAVRMQLSGEWASPTQTE